MDQTGSESVHEPDPMSEDPVKLAKRVRDPISGYECNRAASSHRRECHHICRCGHVCSAYFRSDPGGRLYLVVRPHRCSAGGER